MFLVAARRSTDAAVLKPKSVVASEDLEPPQSPITVKDRVGPYLLLILVAFLGYRMWHEMLVINKVAQIAILHDIFV